MEVHELRQRVVDIFDRIGAGVVNDIAWVVIEAEDARPVDARKDIDPDLGGRQHVAVGFHADLEALAGRLVAQLGHIGEIGFPFFIGFGVAGEGVDDRHAKEIRDIYDAAKALFAFFCLKLGVPGNADRIQAKIGEFGLDAVQLGVGHGVRVDVLEPALDRADLAVAVAGLRQTLQRLIDREGGKDDGRAQD